MAIHGVPPPGISQTPLPSSRPVEPNEGGQVGGSEGSTSRPHTGDGVDHGKRTVSQQPRNPAISVTPEQRSGNAGGVEQRQGARSGQGAFSIVAISRWAANPQIEAALGRAIESFA